MDMIIAELHDKSREIYRRARVALLSSMLLEGRDELPALTKQEQEDLPRMSTKDAVLHEAHAIRVEALQLKLSVLDHRLNYPTEAALHRRLMRACQCTAMAIEAEARLVQREEGESHLYTSLMAEARAKEEEANGHMKLADESEQKLVR